MLIVIDNMLDSQDVVRFRNRLEHANWQDGVSSAGSLSTTVKHNQQVNDNCDIAMSLANELLAKYGNHPRFIAAAIPDKIHIPRFNRYRVGETYGVHIDSAIMPLPHTDGVLRTDLAATLFLSEPESYDGGELVIETEFGIQEVKLEAGGMVLYSAGSLHRVMPVTRGERLGAICWIQSMIRDAAARAILFDLDESIQTLTREALAGREELLRLSSVYHNLVRMFAGV